MDIKIININDLRPYENNPRHNDEAVKYVTNSIKEFGFKVPVVIDANNVIAAGHTRYKAALNLGYKEIPCVIADDLTPEQIKAFRLADNKTHEFSAWDFSLLEEQLESISELDMSVFGFEVFSTEPDYGSGNNEIE
jgi:ParB/RepB/Spo0J family partition protein